MDERSATAEIKAELKRIVNDPANWENTKLDDVTLFKVVGVFNELHLKKLADDDLTTAYELLNNRHEAEIAAWLAGYIDQWRVFQKHAILGD